MRCCSMFAYSDATIFVSSRAAAKLPVHAASCLLIAKRKSINTHVHGQARSDVSERTAETST